MMHLFYLLVSLAFVQGGNVIFFMPIIPKSNKMTWYPLAEEMAKRGHQVTTINPYKSTTVCRCSTHCLKTTEKSHFTGEPIDRRNHCSNQHYGQNYPKSIQNTFRK